MKTFSITLNLLLILACSVMPAFAENNTSVSGKTASITGRILDSDNYPLPGATLILKEINQGAVSDNNGIFRINNLKPGNYTLQISYIGYESIERSLKLEAAKTYTENFTLTEGIALKEVVVQGIMKDQTRALNQQKNNINITNIVSSDQVGQFPDNNIGDALKRIPGINVQYDQGEARFGHIRGTAPEYNSVTINGDRIPSAEAEIRSIQLDLVPSDMVQTIEVNKVITPDMEADAIGGSVNLITRSNPFKQQFSARIGTGYNFLSEDPQLLLSAMYGNRIETGGESSFGMVFSASYQDNQLGSDNIEAEWEEDDNGNAYASDFQIRTYYLQRIRQSYSASFDYNFNPDHKIELKGIYNRRKDWENRFRLQYKDIEQEDGNWITEVRRQTKGGTNRDRRLEDQETMNFALNGEHHFGNVEINWKGSYSKASEDRPNERYITMRAKDAVIIPDLSNTKKPMFSISDPQLADLSSEYGLKELTEEFQYTEDIDKNLKLDIKFPILNGKNKNTLKTGFRFKSKEKKRDNKFFDIEPNDEDKFVASTSFANQFDATKSDFMAGDYIAGHFVSKKYLAILNFNNATNFEQKRNIEEEAGNFDATEDVYAGYIRLDQDFGKKLKMIFGLRIEQTELEYSGRILTIPTEDEEDAGAETSLTITPKEKNDYNNVLPSVIARYSFSDHTKLKLAWTNTISRPKYYDLVPHSEINNDDNEIEIGNPTLEPTTSMNIDVMAEHYFSNVGIISGGFFYKALDDISNTIERRDFEYNGNIWDKFNQSIKVGDADLYGFEFAFQRQLDFLPGFLSNMGIYANYTYTHSEMKNINISGRENEDLAIAGTPENNMNLSLFYESKKLNVRLSLQYADDFIDEWGESAFYDRYYDEITHMDVNAGYNINSNFSIFASVNNILNEPLRYYQGNENRTMQAEYYGTKANIGLKMNF